MKGIILAGGSGTRLHPITRGISKHLLPIYDKPMIYYPLSVLMLAGIRDILIITTKDDQSNFIKILGNGSSFGINLTYEIQNEPNGLAEAFIIGKDFIKNDNVCLILGDNFFWGSGLPKLLKAAKTRKSGASVFCYRVDNPCSFGVAEFDNNFKVKSIEEKPKFPKSNFAVTGLYFYDNRVVKYASEVKPSSRGELEISSINKKYLDDNELHVEILGRGYAWLDTGSHDSLLSSGSFVETIESRQGFKVACLEEIGLTNGWITPENLRKSAESMRNNPYGKYLFNLLEENY